MRYYLMSNRDYANVVFEVKEIYLPFVYSNTLRHFKFSFTNIIVGSGDTAHGGHPGRCPHQPEKSLECTK